MKYFRIIRAVKKLYECILHLVEKIYEEYLAYIATIGNFFFYMIYKYNSGVLILINIK
jgi:hypothetical protein